MPSTYDTLSSWARRASSSFAELGLDTREAKSRSANRGLIYRLKHWPTLPESCRTAHIFQTLSLMSNRPVNREWILTHTRLNANQVDRLLQRLVDEDAVDVVDASAFGPVASRG